MTGAGSAFHPQTTGDPSLIPFPDEVLHTPEALLRSQLNLLIPVQLAVTSA